MPLTPKERDSFRNPFGTTTVFVITGELVEITYVKSEREKSPPQKRGRISGFTRGSRMRMLRTLAQIDWGRCRSCLFITLTYPDNCFDGRPEASHRERYLFLRAMENHLGKEVGVLWRVEWKRRLTGVLRGSFAPHVHLLVFGCSFVHWKTIRLLWSNVLHVDGPLATDVRRVLGNQRAARYVSKYAAKMPDADSLDYASKVNYTGRHWGIHRRNLVPWHEKKVFCTGRQDIVRLMENAACSIFPAFTRDARQGFCLFGETGRKIGEEILLRIAGHEGT